MRVSAKLTCFAVLWCLKAEKMGARKPAKPAVPSSDMDINCKNGDGEDVDWFIAYKLPKTKSRNSNSFTPQGGELAYVDSTGKSMKYWDLLNKTVYEKGNPISKTLAPIYNSTTRTSLAYVIYNDQLPLGFKGHKKGHSKGVLIATEKKGAVWLQHSVPRFPLDIKRRYEYPESGRENGQLFLCLSVPRSAAETIALHLRVQGANVYQSSKPNWMDLRELYTTQLGLLILGQTIRGASEILVNLMKTRKNKPILAIAKAPYWYHDIYSLIVIRQVNDSIAVQSWRNGAGGAQTQTCSEKYGVTDVEEVSVKFSKTRAISFDTREDHSKWDVALKKGFFCFSTLNRMVSQFRRGGEITCLWDDRIATLFRDSIARRSNCGRAE